MKGTKKSQRIAFARLDPFPGDYIQAEGETDINHFGDEVLKVSLVPALDKTK